MARPVEASRRVLDQPDGEEGQHETEGRLTKKIHASEASAAGAARVRSRRPRGPKLKRDGPGPAARLGEHRHDHSEDPEVRSRRTRTERIARRSARRLWATRTPGRHVNNTATKARRWPSRSPSVASSKTLRRRSGRAFNTSEVALESEVLMIEAARRSRSCVETIPHSQRAVRAGPAVAPGVLFTVKGVFLVVRCRVMVLNRDWAQTSVLGKRSTAGRGRRATARAQELDRNESGGAASSLVIPNRRSVADRRLERIVGPGWRESRGGRPSASRRGRLLLSHARAIGGGTRADQAPERTA